MECSRALTKRSADSMLMGPPPPPTKRIKRPTKVLDEDAYTDALSRIIARDFFPGLVETQAQREYLSALDSNNKSWIREAGEKLVEAMTPGPEGRRARGRRGVSMTPLRTMNGGETPKGWSGDTPRTINSLQTTAAGAQKSEVDTNLSLSAFQAKYTSEDNESFYKLLDTQNEKKAERLAWAHQGNKIARGGQIAWVEREANMLKAREAEAAENEGGKQVLRIDYQDTRKAVPDTWRHKAKNGFMFTPEDMDDSIETQAVKAANASKAAPKAVAYENTRMPPPRAIPRPSSPTLSTIQDAIHGRPRLSSTATPSIAGDSGDGSETPRENGWAYIDSEPTLEEEAGAAALLRGDIPVKEDDSPEQDPMALLRHIDKTPNPFTIKESSKREDLHHRLVEKTSRQKRENKALNSLKTPVPRFTSSPLMTRTPRTVGGTEDKSRPMLTAAAQRLLGRVAGTPKRQGPEDENVWAAGQTPRTRSKLGVTPRRE